MAAGGILQKVQGQDYYEGVVDGVSNAVGNVQTLASEDASALDKTKAGASLTFAAATTLLPAATGAKAAGKVLGKLEKTAATIAGKLDDFAQTRRTTAVLKTDMGVIVAGGGRDLSAAQRTAATKATKAGGIVAVLPGKHAEETALAHARKIGATNMYLATSRGMCPRCQNLVTKAGGTLVKEPGQKLPTKAFWEVKAGPQVR